MNNQRLAFVHDRLYYIAGAEQVFFDLIHDTLKKHSGTEELRNGGTFKIFTMFSNKHFLILSDNQNQHAITIPIIPALPRRIFAIFVFFDRHKIPFLSKLLDYRNLMFFYPLLIRILKQKIKRFRPDQTIISSFAVAKNVANHELGAMRYKLHAQSPFMYIHNHYENNLKKLRFPIKQFYQFAHRFLTPWDLQPRHYHHITANSKYTAQLIKHIYNLDPKVLYPKLDPIFFSYPLGHHRSDYFVFVGRLVTFSKQVDIIIKAFNESGQKLKIIGAGPDEAFLKSIATSNIQFLGRVSDPHARCEIIGNARGLVNITLESFGYVTAESICLGTPVIGFNQGATQEIINNEGLVTNGVLIEKQTVESLAEGIKTFEKQNRDHEAIATQARSMFQQSDLQFHLE